MSSLELRRSTSPETIENGETLSPHKGPEALRAISSKTEESLEGRSSSLIAHIETSRLSPEKRASYNERASQLLKKYSGRARQLRDIAVVALVMSAATPSFAEEKDVEKVGSPVSISLTAENDRSILEQTNSGSNKDIIEAAPVHSQTEDTALESEVPEPEVSPAVEDSNVQLNELPDPDTTTSIIMNALEAAAKDQIEHAKQNPIETGAKLSSRFLKGPLKYLGDAIEVGKGIQEGKYKNDTAADTALKVGKFLLDIKTFGLGSLVVDYLRAQKAQPE